MLNQAFGILWRFRRLQVLHRVFCSNGAKHRDPKWNRAPAPSQAALNRWLRARRRQRFEDFAELAEAEMASMDPANLVICLSRLVRELEETEVQQKRGKAIDMNMALNLLGQLLAASEQKLGLTDSPHTLSNLAWALARLDKISRGGNMPFEVHQRFMYGVVRRALDVGLDGFPMRDLPVLIWAVAWMCRGIGGLLQAEERREIFRALTSGVGLSLPEVAPQGLAMLMWALAALDNSAGSAAGSALEAPVPRALFKAIAEEASGRIEGLSAREMANVAWSFATLRVGMPPWLVEELPRRARNLQPQDCANTLWALAVASQPVEDLVCALPHEDPNFFQGWKPQEMANAAWALVHGCRSSMHARGHAMTEIRSRALFSMRAAVGDRVDKMTGAELAMIASSLHYKDDETDALLACLADRALDLLHQESLAPDVICQIVERKRALGMEVPEALKKASDQSCAHALSALRRQSNEVLRVDALQEIQALGMTTLGAKATESFLEAEGLANAHGSAGNAAWQVTEMLSEGSCLDTRVLCNLSYRLLLSTQRRENEDNQHRSLVERGRLVCSGSDPDVAGGGLLMPVTLRFSRERDAEFLALTAVVADARRAAAEIGSGTWELRGDVWMHVSQTPCLSCIGAMVQFQHIFPAVKLHVSFDQLSICDAA